MGVYLYECTKMLYFSMLVWHDTHDCAVSAEAVHQKLHSKCCQQLSSDCLAYADGVFKELKATFFPCRFVTHSKELHRRRKHVSSW
jgi:hypothetical protein